MQSTTELSSGESEYNALLRSSVHALGIKAILNNCRYGWKCEIHMRHDSSAARACLLGNGGGQLDMLTCVSCGHNPQYRKDV